LGGEMGTKVSALIIEERENVARKRTIKAESVVRGARLGLWYNSGVVHKIRVAEDVKETWEPLLGIL